MSRHPVSAEERADAAPFKNELLGHLGLRTDASDQDVEAAHYVLLEFLELAPHEANSWAAARTADMDEAFALLSGPEQGLISASQIASRAQQRLDEAPEPYGTAPATLTAPMAPAPKPRRTQIFGAIGAVLVVSVVLLVFQMDVPGVPTSQQTTARSGGATVVPVNQAKVAALMKKFTADPKDTASLLALGDIYFAAADYKDASAWEQKALGVDPKNKVALLAVGASQFNLGNVVEAKKQWLIAAGLYPKSAEVHYDLGFLYRSQTPPDRARMTAEWTKVVAIDPNSNFARTVSTHLTSSTPTTGGK